MTLNNLVSVGIIQVLQTTHLRGEARLRNSRSTLVIEFHEVEILNAYLCFLLYNITLVGPDFDLYQTSAVFIVRPRGL